MARKILQHRQRLLLPAFGVALAEASSTARLVRLRLEGEAAAQGSDLVEGSGAADCPPRQGACQLLHVGLAMAAAARVLPKEPARQSLIPIGRTAGREGVGQEG